MALDPHINPASGVWDDNYFAQQQAMQRASGGGQSGGGFNFDPMQYIKQAQEYQLQQNQPAIQTLTGQKQSLADQYKSLLDSVMQSGTVASNQAITGENNLLASRGIVNSSPLYNQQMSSALLPVETQNKSLAANVGMGSAQDINQIASQIASLQAGNVPGALSFASGIGGLQAQLQQAQIQAANNIAVQRLQNQFQNVAPGNNLVNTLNNFAVNPSTLTSKAGGATWLNNQ